MALTTSTRQLPTILTWSTRLGWATTAIATSQALETLDTGLTVALSTLLLWVIGAVAVSIGTPITLTLARTILPLGIPPSAWALVAGGSVTLSTIGLIAALITSYSVFTAEVGQRWVQAAAYGAERRFPLRPPLGFALPAVMLWLLVALLASSAVVAAQRSQSWLAVALGVIGAALAGLGSTRWHRLSCRWLVLVPAGVVIHDPLVLLETAMWRSHVVSGAELAATDTEAADLTGPATGPALEISLRASETVVLAAGRKTPEGRAIHLTAALIAPSRPGAALEALRSPR